MTLRLTLARTAFVLLVVVSLALFLLPVTPSGAPGSDKVGHLAVFGVLAVVGRWARLRALPLLLGLTAYAALTEVLQATLPLGRFGDPADLAADVVGLLLGLGAWELGVRARRGRPGAPSHDRRPG